MPVRKPKPPVSEWIVRERKRMGWKVADLSQRLLDLGYDAQIPTVQVWEAGRSPRAETIDGLERLFGSTAPRPDDSADLASAIRAQAAAIADLAQAIREDRDRIAPAALSAFLAQLASEGLLLVPDRPASTDVPGRLTEAGR